MDVTADDPDRPWSDPGVYRVAPGVHRIPLPLPGDALRAVNVYALDDGEHLTLVDSGQPGTGGEELLEEALRALDRPLADVRRVLVTHLHRDHYTLAVTLRRRTGVTVALGAGEAGSLKEINQPSGASELGGTHLDVLRRCGADELVQVLLGLSHRDTLPQDVWEEPDTWLEDLDDLPVGSRTLTAVSTPGHTAGHLVFHDAGNALLFAGDHVLPHITPSIGFEAARVPHPLQDFLGALRRVRAMPDARLLPAHGRVTDSTHARIDELLDHHDGRLAATFEAVRSGRATAYAVAQGLTWTRRERALGELDPFNQMLAVLETEAHLDVLAAQGRVRAEERDGVSGYRVA